MDKESDLSNRSPDEIRHQIEETRCSLTEKLETLENEVKETVRGATDAVVGTVQTVKTTVEGTVGAVRDTVQDTLQSVRQTFDVRRQVQNHPWPMVGGSVALGYLLGSLLPRPRSLHWRSAAYSSGEAGWPEQAQSYPSVAPLEESRTLTDGVHRESNPPGRSFWSDIAEQFAPEIEQAKKLAIGAAVALVRDAIKEALPDNLSPQVSDLVDSVTSKLGGEPVSGPIFQRTARRQPAQPNGVS